MGDMQLNLNELSRNELINICEKNNTEMRRLKKKVNILSFIFMICFISKELKLYLYFIIYYHIYNIIFRFKNVYLIICSYNKIFILYIFQFKKKLKRCDLALDALLNVNERLANRLMQQSSLTIEDMVVIGQISEE